VPGKRKAGASKVFEKYFIMKSTEILLPCKNSFGNTIGAPKTAPAGERPVSSLRCVRWLRSTKGNSSVQVARA
jgi:hypothetical protein